MMDKFQKWIKEQKEYQGKEFLFWTRTNNIFSVVILENSQTKKLNFTYVEEEDTFQRGVYL